MKRLRTAISVLVTIAALACLALIPPSHASEKSELESKVDAFLKVGDYDRAFKLVDSYLEEHADNPIGYAMLERVITAGSGFLNAADRKRALKLIDGYIQEYPAKPIGRAMMVRVLAADGQTDSAFIEYYRFYKLSETISSELLIEIVRGAINHSNLDVRTEAAETANSLHDKGAVPTLISAFLEEMKRSTPTTFSDMFLRLSLTRALGVLGDKRATPALIEGLNHSEVGVRMHAASALGKLGDKSAVPSLINVLNENDEEGYNHFQDNVIEALGELGDRRASSVLLKALKASKSYNRVRAALALAKVGNGFYKEFSTSVLIDILNDDSNRAQRRAAEALVELGDERGVSAVLDALKNNISVSRGSAAQIRLGEKGDRRAIPYLISILNAGYNNRVRSRAAAALGEFRDKRAIPALLSALSNNDAYISSNRPGFQDHMAASGLVKVHAAEALAKLGDERGLSYLMDVFSEGDDSSDRGEVVLALGKLGVKRVVPDLIEIVGANEYIGLKFCALEALVKLSR